MMLEGLQMLLDNFAPDSDLRKCTRLTGNCHCVVARGLHNFIHVSVMIFIKTHNQNLCLVLAL